MSLGALEKRVARGLNRFPLVKRLGKRGYQWLGYLASGNVRFRSATEPGVRLTTPEAWAGVEPLPGEHFFGYYDKSPWNPDCGRFLLHSSRSRRRSDPIEIVMLDARAHAAVSLARTHAWNVQQGSMTQWLSHGGEELVVFNDFEGDDLIARIVDPAGRERSRLPMPVQALHPASGRIVSLNYNRLFDHRVDYAYARKAANQALPVDRDGLFLMGPGGGTPRLRVGLDWFLAERPRPCMAGADHWLNHAMFSPSGRDFIVMHRWGRSAWRKSRLYRVPVDDGDPTLLLDEDMISHYHWMDDRHVVAYCRCDGRDGYFVIDAFAGRTRAVPDAQLQEFGDGHPAVDPADGRAVTDTYPGRRGVQTLSVFRPDSGGVATLGAFAHSPRYHGPDRCDLHPRWRPDGGAVSFDSVLDGRRRSWILELGDSP